MKRSTLLTAVILTMSLAASFALAQTDAPKGQKPMGGMGMMGGQKGDMSTMMSQMTPEMRKKMMDQTIKFIRDNSKLITDVITGRMELQELWIDDNPNADQIVAKMRSVNAQEEQLEENWVASMIGMFNSLPADMKKGFMMMHRRMMHRGMMGMGMGMMPGMMGMSPSTMMGSCMTGMDPSMMGSGMMESDAGSMGE